jgi:site-specific recombinase
LSRAAITPAALLARLDPQAGVAERHLQLIALLDWVRGSADSEAAAASRLEQLVQCAEADPALTARLQAWWSAIAARLDVTTLLADFGFAQRTSLASEVAERLRHKLLPSSPETQDAAELFMLALPQAFDARWLAALDDALLLRLRKVLVAEPEGEAEGSGAGGWQAVVLDAMTYCAGQILATGFAPELRQRMSDAAREAQPFHALIRDVESLRVEVLHPLRTDTRLQETTQRLRERLEACRAAAASVYTHFDDNGISVGLVFRLRQLRERIVRMRELLECLLSERPAATTCRLLARLVTVGRERRSLRALLAANTSLLAAKMAERNAETGEHYITRTPAEYLAMVRMAAGGGVVMAFTTLIKFGLYALALSAFWSGFAAGVNYALSFVLIQLLHFTVATKQPAMTAPAMAAKLKELSDDASVEDFVDKVTYLVRSQAAAVLGNVLLVFPAALGLSLLYAQATGHAAIDQEHAGGTLASLHLLGPSLLFAAYTGVLLFASSICAGWMENWFVLHRLGSAIAFNPRITATLGRARAARWSRWLRENIAALTVNVSLGFMLGLTPAFAGFFGLGLEARHVTLSSGQLGVATATLGWQSLYLPAFWWAAAMIPFNGALNVGVSFYLAFRLALRAHNVGDVDRARIYRALRARARHAPLEFFLPLRGNV